MSALLEQLQSRAGAGRKQLAVLLDPDKVDAAQLPEAAARWHAAGVTHLFVGGSLMTQPKLEQLLAQLRKLTDLPLILFPGSVQQVVPGADGMLFLSLISGRNPEYLIGQHVTAAPLIQANGLEPLPTGYMLVDCGKPTAASYMSATPPLPYDKPEIAAATALAGQYLGLQLMYLDGGSGAPRCVAPAMIRAVREVTQAPLIVGGGIRTAADAERCLAAGADMLVIGNALEATQGDELLEALQPLFLASPTSENS
jgi:putative glycerol-1-phosphate prenyltransferase